MTSRRKPPPSKVLEEARKLARAVRESPRAGGRAGEPRAEKAKKKSGDVAREKIVAALKKLHPMD